MTGARAADSGTASSRWLLWIIYAGCPILAVLYLATTWDATHRYGPTYANPLIWGFKPFLEGAAATLAGQGAAVVRELSAFYRSDPWGNWVLVDHLGLKILLSFGLYGHARSRGRRSWPWIVAIYVVGALSPLLYLAPELRSGQAAIPSLLARPSALGEEG